MLLLKGVLIRTVTIGRATVEWDNYHKSPEKGKRAQQGISDGLPFTCKTWSQQPNVLQAESIALLISSVVSTLLKLSQTKPDSRLEVKNQRTRNWRIFHASAARRKGSFTEKKLNWIKHLNNWTSDYHQWYPPIQAFREDDETSWQEKNARFTSKTTQNRATVRMTSPVVPLR